MNEQIEIKKEERKIKRKLRVETIKYHIKRSGIVIITGGACLVIGAAATAAYMILHGTAVSDDELRKIEREQYARIHDLTDKYFDHLEAMY